ncbi:MAG: hypothetical protein TYPL_5280 [Candidatus Tyloplasma litorale]|nr:MAG: hypothetical protein TYPL_5280 [Mycoplasmatales bacterium]
MKKNNKENKSSSQHSFYKEANKSIFAQQQWTSRKVGGFFLKFFKWGLYCFLIIATLWGCVNEFIIQTSNNLGQGVEFYQKDDFVYPNMYQSLEITGYTNSPQELEEGIIYAESDDSEESDEIVDDMNSTEAFNFNVVNPYFGKTEDDENYEDWWKVDEFYVKAGDTTTPNYTYNLNFLTASSAGLYNYDSEALTVDWLSTDGRVTPTNTIPSAILTAANDEVESKEINDDYNYSVSSTLSFAFYLADKSDGGVDGKAASFANNSYFDWIEDETIEYTYYDLSGVNGTILPANEITTVSAALEPSNWDPTLFLDVTYDDEEDGTDELAQLIIDQAKYEVNKLAFNNGTLQASYSDLDSDLQQAFFDAGLDSNFTYSADFTDVLPSGNQLGVDTFGGAQVFVIPISKGFPIDMTQESKDLITEGDKENNIDPFRDENFRDWQNDYDSQYSNQGFDSETQMYGWTLLDASNEYEDGKLDILRTYSAEGIEKALNGEEDIPLDEDHAFYADQRRLGWGAVGEDSTESTFNSEESDYSVFDEKIKDMMQDTKDNYMLMSGNASVGSESLTYEYGSTFAGITSIDEITETSSWFTGTLPVYENGYSVNGDNVIIERSIFSDSIIPTGQDAWGESRIAFVGWSDWGKAWNVQYGPLYGAFVFPLAQISMWFGEWFSYDVSPWGTLLSIIIIVFFTRGLGALLSLKGTGNQLKMQEVQTDVAKIKSKYNKYDLKKEPRMKQKQQQEIMALYRKNNVNPMGSLGTIFITMPIFISLWIIISALPAYKIVSMGSFSWAVSSWYGIFNFGGMFFLYLLVGVSVGLVQGVSSKLPTWLGNKRKGIKRIDEATKESQKKQNRTQNIMIGVFVFMGLTVPALFAFYWICSGIFTILLELTRHAWRVHVAKQKKLDPTYTTPMRRFSVKMKNKFSKIF